MNQWSMRDYLRVLFRQKKIIITSALVVTAVAIIGFSISTRQYEAEVKMLVSGEKEIDAPYYKQLFDTDNSPESLTQIEIVTANPVLERTVKVLKLYDRPFDYEAEFASPLKKYLIEYEAQKAQKKFQSMPPEKQRLLRFRQAVDDLRKHIKVEPIKETNVFTIHVRDFDPVAAALLANVISRSYVIFDLEQQLAELKLKYGPRHPIVLQLEDNIKDMSNNLSGKILPDTESIGPASVKIIQQASVPLTPTSQHRSLIVALALITGIFFGMVLAFIFEYMDQSIKSGSEAENLLQLPLLGSIPQIHRWNMLINSSRWFPRRYKSGINNLADQITLLQSETGFKSLVLTACNLKDGTSSISANLAITASEYSKKNVLLMEANFRHPAMRKLFKIEQQEGLADVLAEEKDLNEVMYQIAPGLTLIPAGKAEINPVVLLDSPRMRQVMQELRPQFDLIVIDSPELSHYKDGFLLSSIADKTLPVLVENHTRRQVALRILNLLGQWRGKVLGLVLNRRLYAVPGWLYEQV